jgi:hypothetical protein
VSKGLLSGTSSDDLSATLLSLTQLGGEAARLVNYHSPLMRRWTFWSKQRRLTEELLEFGRDPRDIVQSYWRHYARQSLSERQIGLRSKLYELELYTELLRYMSLNDTERNRHIRESVENPVQ